MCSQVEVDAEAPEYSSARTRIYDWRQASKCRDAFSFLLSGARRAKLLERTADPTAMSLSAPAPAPAAGQTGAGVGASASSSSALAPASPAFDMTSSPTATPGGPQGPAQPQQQQGLPDTISYKKLYACQLHDMLAVFRFVIFWGGNN